MKCFWKPNTNPWAELERSNNPKTVCWLKSTTNRTRKNDVIENGVKSRTPFYWCSTVKLSWNAKREKPHMKKKWEPGNWKKRNIENLNEKINWVCCVQKHYVCIGFLRDDSLMFGAYTSLLYDIHLFFLFFCHTSYSKAIIASRFFLFNSATK